MKLLKIKKIDAHKANDADLTAEWDRANASLGKYFRAVRDAKLPNSPALLKEIQKAQVILAKSIQVINKG